MAWNEPGPGRDPWKPSPGGKRGDGTPDFDELLKRLKARFGRGRPGAPEGKLPGGVAPVVGMVLAALWLLSGFFSVDEQERGLLQRFGAYAGTAEPGLHWHLPWPIERVELIDFTRLRRVSDRATVITQDQNLVDIELGVEYRVSSAEDFFFNVADPDRTLQQAAEASVREVVGRTTVDQVLDDGRQTVSERTKALLQKRLDVYRSGLSIHGVTFKAQPPDAVKAAFVDAINAAAERDTLTNQAQAYASDHLPKARGEAARNLAEAAGYRDRTIARAEGDAARFTALLEEYRKAPKVTRQRLYLDTFQDIYANTSKVLIDVDKGSPVINLPLDQLLRNPAKADAAADSVAPPPAAARGSSGRDETHPRDRGSR